MLSFKKKSNFPLIYVLFLTIILILAIVTYKYSFSFISTPKSSLEKKSSAQLKNIHYFSRTNANGNIMEENLTSNYTVNNPSLIVNNAALEKNNYTITRYNIVINKDNSTKNVFKNIYIKEHHKETFFPIKDFALFVITLFSYLLIFTLLKYRSEIMKFFGIRDFSPKEDETKAFSLKFYKNTVDKEHEELISFFEELERDAKKNNSSNEKTLKATIKELKEIQTFNKYKEYELTTENLVKVYKNYFNAKLVLKNYFEKDKEHRIKKFEKILELLTKKLDDIKKRLDCKNENIQSHIFDFNRNLIKIKWSQLKIKWSQSDKQPTIRDYTCNCEWIEFCKYLNENKKISYFNVDSDIEIPKESLNQVLKIYEEIQLNEDIPKNPYIQSSILKINKRKVELKQDSTIENLNDIFSAYDIIEKIEIEIEKEKENRLIKSLFKLVEHKKHTKKLWSIILEIIEEKAHHSLLSSFKTYDLRIRPYSIKALTYDITEVVNEFKISSIYHKIYNVLLPLKNKVQQNTSNQVDSELMNFITSKINELQIHRYKTAQFFIRRYGIMYAKFSAILLVSMYGISYLIGNNELVYMNTLFLSNFMIVFIVSEVYFGFKKITVQEFGLAKNKISHFVNNITLLFVAFSSIILLDVLIDNFIEEHISFNMESSVYMDIITKLGQLLLPSSFKEMHSIYELSPIQIFIYKIVFLILIGYLFFTIINFLIHKYDSLYFNKEKKTLIPPELALISINFLFAILLLGLMYGTYMHYLDALSYVESYADSQTVINAMTTSDGGEESSNYIPFSIFIAVVGGLLTMATRDLLENYFAGISLQMDSPYEEHDRITINDSDMLEVRHIGIRADRFYDIKANAILVIPHKQLIDENILNYTLPTLDYRNELTIYIPHVDKENIKMSSSDSFRRERSLPKRAEMLMLLSIFVNTGVKIPKLNIEENTDSNIEILLQKYRYFIAILLKKEKKEVVKKELETEINIEYKNKLTQVVRICNRQEKRYNKQKEKYDKAVEEYKKKNKESTDKNELKKIKDNLEKIKKKRKKIDDCLTSYNTTLDDWKDIPTNQDMQKNLVKEIWEELHSIYDNEEDDEVDNLLKNLFISKLIKAVDEAENDQDEKHAEKEADIILKIKSTVVAILLSLESYERDEKELYHHYDDNFVLRKYQMFRETHKKVNNDKIQNMAEELVNINYYYFDIAASLWKLKELQNSLYRKREIDSTSLELLDVPRVTTEHIYSGEGTISYWKVTADLSVQLAEQSNEITHHIHMYIDNLWEDFDLPKYYRVENKKEEINIKKMTIAKLIKRR